MPDATLRERAGSLLTASGRSDVPPFMVMDVMAAAARIEADGGHVIHMEVGQPAASAPQAAIAAARAALEVGRIDYTSALGMPSLRERIARHYRESYGCTVEPRADRGHHGIVGRVHPGVSRHVRAGRPRRGHRARLSAVSPYPDRARLRAGADRDHQRDPSCADRRGVACRPSPHPPEGRAGRKPGQSDRHHDVARGAHRPDRGGGRRRHPLHLRRNLSWPRLCVSRGDGGGVVAACAGDQFVLEIFLHDRLAGRLDGGAGPAGAADRAAAAESRRSRCRRCRRLPPKRHSTAARRWKRSSTATRRTAAS